MQVVVDSVEIVEAVDAVPCVAKDLHHLIERRGTFFLQSSQSLSHISFVVVIVFAASVGTLITEESVDIIA